MKPFKFSVALVVKNAAGEILAVKRPPHDESLPTVWGLPAVTIKPGELPEDAARRVCTEKLACTAKLIDFVGIKSADQGVYRLILMDIEARVASGSPNVDGAQTTGTKYVEQKWTSDLSIFADAARKGSLCSQVLLDVAGIAY
ncbi:MAG: NUDIX hydrolase [Candidatus Andersenbacteria bacterium]